jgi:hypothetical protein
MEETITWIDGPPKMSGWYLVAQKVWGDKEDTHVFQAWYNDSTDRYYTDCGGYIKTREKTRTGGKEIDVNSDQILAHCEIPVYKGRAVIKVTLPTKIGYFVTNLLGIKGPRA